MTRMIQKWQAAILLILATLLTTSCGTLVQRGATPAENHRSDSTGEAVTDDAGNTSAQTGGGILAGHGLGGFPGQPTYRATGSSSAKESRSKTPLSTRSNSPRSESPPQAGPPVYYEDNADDAYGPASLPDSALSQREFDILRVDWAPASFEKQPGGYSTSITLAGTARAGGSYMSYGVFPSGVYREECQLYHLLTPGITAYANALCGTDETRRLVGRVRGTQVTSTPTESGGTVLSATFDSREIPALLQAAGRQLYGLSSFTCQRVDGRLDCSGYDVLDWARSTETFRV